MNSLERYIGLSVVKGIGFALLALLVLMSFLNIVDELGKVNERYSIGTAFLYVALNLPRLAYELLPSIVLLGTLLGLGQLARHSELIAMRASGLSVQGVAFTLVKVGVLISVLAFLIGEGLAPPSAQKAQRLRAVAESGRSALFTDNGFWLRDGHAYLNIRDVGGPRSLAQLYIYEFDKDLQLRLATKAQRAEFDGEQWRLHDLALSKISPERIETERLERAAWGSVLDPSLLNVIVVGPELLPVWQVRRYANFLRDNGQRSSDVDYVYWSRVLAPLNILALMLIALPFVFAGNPRGGQIGKRLFIGTLVGVAFYMVSKAAGQVALVYALSPFLSVVVPTLAFLGTALWMMARGR